MAEKSKEIIHDTRIEGKEIQTDSGNKITFNGNYFWTKTSGFIEQLNVYFFVDIDGQNQVIEWNNGDAGKGWFLRRWKERGDETFSARDAYVYKMIFSKMPEREGQISKPEWLFWDSESEESRNFIDMLENLK